MKCARCGHDSTYPQRSGGVCPGCKGRFAFEPRTGDPLPDMAWKGAIDQVSSNGTVRFTPSHLHHAVARRARGKASGTKVGLLIVGVVMAVVGGAGEIQAVLVVGGALVLIGALVAVTSGLKPDGLTLERATFDALFERWCAAHGTPKGLIAPRASARHLTEAMRRELESYSFDRAVICDRPETVDVLLGNDFHFENNCAVITAGGYPEHAAPMVKTMLKQNPRLEVFVLHDATVEGCVLAHMLRNDPQWFGGTSVRVFDVALRPAQAERMKGLHWAALRGADVDHPALTESERSWLRGKWMSLAVITPEQLVKRLYRAMQHLPEQADKAAADGGSSSSSGDVILWTSDAHASDGGGDSFG